MSADRRLLRFDATGDSMPYLDLIEATREPSVGGGSVGDVNGRVLAVASCCEDVWGWSFTREGVQRLKDDAERYDAKEDRRDFGDECQAEARESFERAWSRGPR